MPRFILASQSPRRKELLARAGYEFEIVVSEVDETLPQGARPGDAVETLARRKALAVSSQHPGTVVLGCDTVVALGDLILGKPATEAEAEEMLRRLSGQTHTVYSGVCVTDGTREAVFHTATDVTFYPLPDAAIQSYVATGEPMDKAGAYAIQGGFAPYVERTWGPLDNVIGFPYEKIKNILKQW